MSVVTSTIWQLVCPVTDTSGGVSTTTRPFPATFIVPTATRAANVLPSGMPPIEISSITIQPTGTLLPPDTFAPDEDGVRRLTVHVPIHTTLVVDLFPNPLPSPIETYRPVWNVTRDGSMVTEIYRDAAFRQHTLMIMAGFLLCIFIRNVIVSIDYIRRGRAKDKTLFYLLLASQLWGPVAFISTIAGMLSDDTACTTINLITSTSMEISMSLLVTGILGLKAYRCLNRSIFVLCTVIAFQIASVVLFVMDILKTNSRRALNGMCTPWSSRRPMNIPFSLSLMFIETAFLTLCFLYGVWKSTRFAAAQGRMSIALSGDSGSVRDSIVTTEPRSETPGPPESRGWWDYIPDMDPSSRANSTKESEQPPHRSGSPDSAQILLTGTNAGIKSRVLSRLFLIFGRIPVLRNTRSDPPPGRKSSVHTDQPITQPRQTPAQRLSNWKSSQASSDSSWLRPSLYRLSGGSADSQDGRWRLPNLVRHVVKDELFYTATITGCCLVSAVVATSAASQEAIFSGQVWLQMNWAVTSLLVMRSYAQVVRRHEREAILQQPLFSRSTPIEGSTNRASSKRESQLRFSVASTVSRRPHSLFTPDHNALHPTSILVNGSPTIGSSQEKTPKAADKPISTRSATSSLLIAREYSNPFADFNHSTDHGHKDIDAEESPRPDSGMLHSRTVSLSGHTDRRSPSPELEREWERIHRAQTQASADKNLPAIRFSEDSWTIDSSTTRSRRSDRRSNRLPPIFVGPNSSSRSVASGVSSVLTSPVNASYSQSNIVRRQKGQD